MYHGRHDPSSNNEDLWHSSISAIERLIAFRYLRARRQEGFISVIAVFLWSGIALGVATLIIVMAVMNGFRPELLGRMILGLNGHLIVFTAPRRSADRTTTSHCRPPVRGLDGVVSVDAAGRGPGHGHMRPAAATGALVRGMRAKDDLRASRALIADNVLMQRFAG